MIGSFFMGVLLAALMLPLGDGSVALASEPPKALNIGFVLYSKGAVPGTLNARWTYQNIYSGKGLATGGPKHGFVGHYHVRNYDGQGKFSDEYDLVIGWRRVTDQLKCGNCCDLLAFLGPLLT